MQLRRYQDAVDFHFGHLTIRDMTPDRLDALSMAEIEVPIGADNPPFAGAGKTKLYVGLGGEVEFEMQGERVRIAPGDVLHISPDETYSYHNGGYEAARLLLLQVPGVAEKRADG